MIKDIPFVTNISKYYDKDILDSNYNGSSDSQGIYSNYGNQLNRRNFNTMTDQGNQSDFADLKDSHITDTINSSDTVKNREEELMKALRAQLNYNADDLISQEHLETIKRLEGLEY